MRTSSSSTLLLVCLCMGALVSASPAPSIASGSSKSSQVEVVEVEAKPAPPPQRTLSSDKLKRGLTNFMSQANPAPFFVPPVVPQMQLTQSPGVQQQAAEPAALINGDATAEALIKGPNRLAQARPVGGPLRWGRRRR